MNTTTPQITTLARGEGRMARLREFELENEDVDVIDRFQSRPTIDDIGTFLEGKKSHSEAFLLGRAEVILSEAAEIIIGLAERLESLEAQVASLPLDRADFEFRQSATNALAVGTARRFIAAFTKA